METKPILDFLGELTKNNNREWFEANKPTYKKVKKHFDDIIAELIKGLSELDPLLSELKPKDCTFRIYRDVRFSKNKDPYKTNFGAVIARGGRKSNYALFYFHLDAERSFLAGGIYMPPTDVLNQVRQEIDYNASEFREIISSKEFKKYFDKLDGEQLKRAPKGYSPDDPNIDLLKYKSYLAVHDVARDKVVAEDYIPYALKVYKAMLPMYNFINRSFD